MASFQGASRKTHHISRRVTQTAFKAFNFAYDLGKPFNRYVVINLHEPAQAPAGTIFNKIRHKFRDWHSRATKTAFGEAQPPFYVFTMENPFGSTHVNWVVHVPDFLQAEFERKLPGWVTKAQGVCGDFDVHVQPIRQDKSSYKNCANYILKGTDAAYIDHFHLARVHTEQGVIFGKRAGTSLNLGTAARKAANYNRKWPRPASIPIR